MGVPGSTAGVWSDEKPALVSVYGFVSIRRFAGQIRERTRKRNILLSRPFAYFAGKDLFSVCSVAKLFDLNKLRFVGE